MTNTFGKPVVPDNDEQRVLALRQYDLIGTPPEEAFTNIAHILTQVFHVPIGLISLIDADKVYFKASVGLPGIENIERDTSLCSLTLAAKGLTVIEDAVQEPSLANNPWVVGEFGLRFYAGAPLTTPEGHIIGVVCVVDKQSRSFSESDQRMLEQFTAMVMHEIEMRVAVRKQYELQQQYQGIFEATSDAVLIFDRQGNIVEVNSAACQLYGYSHEELIHMNGQELIHPEDDQGFEKFTKAYRGEALFAIESTHIRKDGMPIQVEVRDSTFSYRGQPHLLSAINDITARKETELVLQRTQILLRTALSAGLVATWYWEIATNRVLADRNLKELFGVEELQPDEGFQLETFLQGIHPDDRGYVHDVIKQVIATGQKYEADYRVINTEGEVRWVTARGQLEYDENQQPVALPGVLVDITERKRAELKFQESEERLKLAIEAAHLGTWDYNLITGQAQWSPTCKELFGLAPDAIINANDLLQRVHPDDQGRVSEANRRILGPESDGNHDIIFRTVSLIDNRERWVHAKGKTILDEQGRIIRFAGIAVDITELKQAQEALTRSAEELEKRVQERTKELGETNEKLRKSNERLEQFAYIASHDLQEPLRKIQSFGHILRDDYGRNLAGDGQDILRRMESAAERMSGLIQDLLNYSRISTKQNPFKPVALDRLIAEVISDLEIPISEAEATIQVDSLPVVVGDASQLRQLFQNLISNSIKFRNPSVRPVISIRYQLRPVSDLPDTARSEYETAMYHCMSVADNGIGFDEKFLDRIFQVFQRLHTRNQYAGTGIGLAICEKVVENHKGAITAESQPGQGATFHVFLPIQQPEKV